jgi:hypothetical protein
MLSYIHVCIHKIILHTQFGFYALPQAGFEAVSEVDGRNLLSVHSTTLYTMHVCVRNVFTSWLLHFVMFAV